MSSINPLEYTLIILIMTFLGYVVGAIVIIITMGLVGLFWGAVLSFKNYLTSFRENFNYQGSEL